MVLSIARTVALLILLCVSINTFARPSILVMGDSLSAAYGMEIEQGWVSLLAARLRSEQLDYDVVNASVSGETSQGGIARLPGTLQKFTPGIVIIELGGNDGLRGLPLAGTRENLSRMVALSTHTGAQVLLVGMRLPPNYGPAYSRQFEQVFVDVADAHDATLVPFLLEGVVLQPNLMQADGIHPSAAAQSTLLNTVWMRLESLLVR